MHLAQIRVCREVALRRRRLLVSSTVSARRVERQRVTGGAPKSLGPRAGSAFSLAITRGGFALELTEPLPVGPLTIRELSSSLPQVRFPADVTGGLSRYRHKRGELESLTLEISTSALATFARERWVGLLGTSAPSVRVTATRNVLHVCASHDDALDAPVLAFDIVLSASNDGLTALVEGARGLNLPAAAPALALQALRAVCGPQAQHEGAAANISAVPLRLARRIFPDAGVRVPSAEGLCCVAIGVDADGIFGRFVRNAGPAPVTDREVLARESARLLRRADDALAAGEFELARGALLDALGAAPEHIETLRRLAELDAHTGGRDEAALGALARVPVAQRGKALVQALRGELLARRGEPETAQAALIDAAQHDAAGPLAARLFCRAASLAGTPSQRLGMLDLAVSRDPLSAPVRRMRMSALLSRGLADDAVAEGQELVAAARGPRARQRAWIDNARAFEDAGATGLAADAFEQALLYAPDSVDALAGLGRALVRTRRFARGAALLSAAIDLGEGDTSELSVLLATVLADSLGDRPLALRRLAELPPGARALGSAFPLEARLRRELGDVAGVGVAYERMRLLGPEFDVAAESYLDAAAFEQARGHLLEARAHALAGLERHAPDPRLEDAVRTLADALAAQAAPSKLPDVAPAAVVPPHVAPPDAAAATAEAVPAGAKGAPDPGPAAEPVAEADADAPTSSPPDSAVDEARIERLIERLRGDPGNDAVADELAVLLVRTGRSMELLALLSARLEDAPEEQRERLLPKQRAVLADLAKGAEEAGRHDEAQLFRDSLDAIS